MDEKTMLKQYLQRQRDAMIWKLDGLSERQLRMPLTPTGTNLLGVVKHAASVDLWYFAQAFDRPFDEPTPWMEPDAEANADFWATKDESARWVRDFATRAWAHSDAVIESLDLDATGVVPWWPPERRNVTLRQVMVHVIQESARHAGHLDIVRELTDGQAGLAAAYSNLPGLDQQEWADYTARLRSLAESFPG